MSRQIELFNNSIPDLILDHNRREIAALIANQPTWSRPVCFDAMLQPSSSMCVISVLVFDLSSLSIENLAPIDKLSDRFLLLFFFFCMMDLLKLSWSVCSDNKQSITDKQPTQQKNPPTSYYSSNYRYCRLNKCFNNIHLAIYDLVRIETRDSTPFGPPYDFTRAIFQVLMVQF